MLYIISRSSYLRPSLTWLDKTSDFCQLKTFFRLEQELENNTSHYSVIVDEDYTAGEVGAFATAHLSDTLLVKLVIMTAAKEDKGHDYLNSDKIAVIRKDLVRKREFALTLGLDEVDINATGLESILVGSSAEMAKLRSSIRLIGPQDCNVIIYGETGSGKELVAQGLHAARFSGEAPTVNCALLEGDLLESFLFGHTKGSFSGAQETKPGLVEQADGSTLILDEIEEMSMRTQAKLLRFLDKGEYHRIGDTSLRHSRCRIIAITNESVRDLLEKRRMRQDFYMRLAGATILVPPLKKHLEDLPELIRAREKERGYSTPIRDIASLMDYSWPGNVRQLFQAVDRIHRNGWQDRDLDISELNLDPGPAF